VLKYVKVSLRSNNVNLLSLNRPAPPHSSPDNHTVVIDETLKEFTVSVSGKNATLTVHNPSGELHILVFFLTEFASLCRP